MYLGDYPDGAYWAAERRAATHEGVLADNTVSGPVIRFMWDYGACCADVLTARAAVVQTRCWRRP